MIDLHFWPTPNGKKVTILLEECGLPYRIVPFPLFELQAKWFAAFLVGTVQRLSVEEMEIWIQRREEALSAQGVPERKFLDYGDDQFTYNDALSDVSCPP